MRTKLLSTLVAPLLVLTVLIGCSTQPAYATDGEPLTVFLVRHGEKVLSGEDPELSAAGVERAATLADTLRDAGLDAVHSSDYRRTRDTAAPLAEALGLEVLLYDPRDLPAIASTLREAGGRHLVVGHSNTTPALVELLGGEPGTEIDEPAEYDRLYIVTIAKDGTSTSALLRYGAPYKP